MIFILLFRSILLNILIQNNTFYCVNENIENNFSDGQHIQNEQTQNLGQSSSVNPYMMPESSQMNAQMPDQKRS